ncbi:MAG: AAA family ATPase [Bacteroidetes bacterium]|nr:AAA family ATPase [Bacteroidota bacterium]
MILKKNDIVNDTYEIKFFIGEGAFGEVYRVKHKFLGLQVLKVFKEKYVENTDLDTITQEAKILSKLTHQNIVRVFETNSFSLKGKKHFFITMGFVSGETLSDLLKREISIPFKLAVKIQIDFLKGLQAAQSNNVIHRDINPDNILLSYDTAPPKALLSDFGLAQTVDQLTEISDAAGRYLFFAPECFSGLYLPTSDVFSAGMVFYKMLTGALPWECEISVNDESNEIATKVISSRKKKPVKPSVFNSEVTPFIDHVILRSLSINIEERYKTALEFLEAVQDALNNKKEKPSTSSSDTESNKKESKKISSNDAKKEHSYKISEKGKGFDKIAGMHELKDLLYTDVIQALKEKELYEQYGVTIPNGMLLYGPPGCGKTFISRQLAEEVDYNFIEIKPSDLASIYVSGRQEKIGKLFNEAREKSPTILFFDEVDALLPNRENSSNQSISTDVNEFLAQMTECGKDGIFIIAATNRPEKIDPAIMRTGRMDKVIYLSPPDKDARVEMMKLLLKKRPVEGNFNYSDLADKTENYVSSDINFIINEAARTALKQRVKINENHIIEVIKSFPPSISSKEIKRYEEFKDKRSFV